MSLLLPNIRHCPALLPTYLPLTIALVAHRTKSFGRRRVSIHKKVNKKNKLHWKFGTIKCVFITIDLLL